jgi:alpha-2-macroglobulin
LKKEIIFGGFMKTNNRILLSIFKFGVLLSIVFIASCPREKPRTGEKTKSTTKLSLPPLSPSIKDKVFPPKENFSTKRDSLNSLLKNAVMENVVVDKKYIDKPYTYRRDFCDVQNIKPLLNIHFNNNMVKKEMIGKEVKNFPVQIIPAWKGKYKWISVKELRFIPNEGWKDGKLYILRVLKSVKSVNGKSLKVDYEEKVKIHSNCYVGQKLLTWTPEKNKPQLVIVRNCKGHYSSYGSMQESYLNSGGICLLFDQPVKKQEIKKLIKIHTEKSSVKKNIKFSLSKINEFEYVELKENYGFKIKLFSPLKNDEKLVLKIDSKLVENNQTGKNYTYNYKFSTTYKISKKNSVVEAYCSKPNNCSFNNKVLKNLNNNFYIKFKNELKWVSDSELKKLISIKPAPLKRKIFVDGNTLNFRLDLNPDKTYYLKINKKLKDAYGYNLSSNYKLKIKPATTEPQIRFKKQVTLEEKGKNRFYFETINMKSISFVYYPVKNKYLTNVLKNMEENKKIPKHMLGKGSSITKTGLYKLNRWKKTYLDFRKTGKNHSSNTFLLEVVKSKPEIKTKSRVRNSRSLIQISNIGISLKVLPENSMIWLNDLNNGNSISGANVYLYDEDNGLSNLILEGKTGINGELIIKNRKLNLYNKINIVVKKDKKTGYMAFNLKKSIQPVKFKIRSGTGDQSKFSGMIFTDRGVYKPGEIVNFKGFYRVKLKNRIKTLSDENVEIIIKNPLGEKVKVLKLKTNKYGSVYGKFKTKSSMKTGKYIINSKLTSYNSIKFKTSVLITSFRKPKFLVSVFSEKKSIIKGETIKGEIEGKYLFGAKMRGSEVKWSVFKEKGYFKPEGYKMYSFNSGTYRNRFRKLLNSGSGKLDKNGKLKWKVDSLAGKSKGADVYIFNTQVQDIDRQVISSTKRIIVHPGEVYVGVRIVNPMVLLNEKVEFESVMVKPSGKPVNGKKLSMKIYKRVWNWYWESDYENRNHRLDESPSDKLVHSCNTKKSSKNSCLTKFSKPGFYYVKVSFKDYRGNIIESTRQFHVSGSGNAGLKRAPFAPMDLKLSKKTYLPGENGKVLVKNPFDNAKILLTVEKFGIIYKKFIKIQKGVHWISFPVDSRMVPNGFLSIYLITPRTTNKLDSAMRDLGGSQYKIGYAQFNVSPEKNRLSVKIKTKKYKKPGENLDILVNIKNSKNNPVKSEIALYVVDESVLSLTNYKTPDPVKHIFKKSKLKFWIQDSRNYISSLNYLYGNTNPGGGGGDGDDSGRSEKKNYKKPNSVTRTNFKNTIYWNPNLVTDEMGNAKISLKLPDNLTTFRVMVVAVDKNDQFGKGESRFKVKKPFMIQPALPLFLVEGDKIKSGVIAHNLTAKPLKVNVKIKVSEGIKLKGSKKYEIIVNPGIPKEIKFEMEAKFVGNSKITFEGIGKSGNEVFVDKVEEKIRINPVTIWKKYQMQGVVNDEESIKIDFPKNSLAHGGEFSVEVSNNSMSGLKDGLEYLVKYPYGCVEQTTSSTYPLIAFMDLFPALGITKYPQKMLRKMIQSGIDRYLKMKTGDGGLAYWPGGKKSHLYGTAYAMLAINAASEKNIPMPKNFQKGVADYLSANLRKEKLKPNMKAYIVYVLAKAGKMEPAYMGELFKNRKKLDVAGRSYLLMALKILVKIDYRLDILANEIKESFNDRGYLKVNPKRDYSMFGSSLKTSATALMALLSYGKHIDLVVKIAQYIMNKREKGYWLTTQKTTYALLALSKYSNFMNSNNEKLKYEILLDGKKLLQTKFKKINSFNARYNFNLKDFINKPSMKLTIRNLSSKGGLFFTLRTNYGVKYNKNKLSSISKNISVYKLIESMDGKVLNNKTLKGGDLIRVRLFVKIPYSTGKIKYMVIDDPLCGGIEALNMDLTTNSITSSKKLSWLLRKTKSKISFKEFRKDRVLFFANTIYSGLWEFSYLARATSTGEFIVPPVQVEAMYDPEILARSEVKKVVIK